MSRPVALVQTASTMTSSPPLALMCLSTTLEGAGQPTEIFDLSVRPDRETELLERARRDEFAWLGLTAMTSGMPPTRALAQRIKDAAPDLPTILGGIHGSTLPQRTLAEVPVDAICKQSGEDVAVGFNAKVQAGERDYWSVPGIAALDGPTFRFDAQANERRSFGPLPRPAWHKIELADYQKVTIQYIRRRPVVAPIITARGCPFACSFCAVPGFSGQKLLHRDVTEVVDEIELLVRAYGVQELQIFDDIFNVKQKYAKAVLRELISRNLDIVWKAPVGFWLLTWDEEFLELLARSGCYQVGFGIESGSRDILKDANKHTADRKDEFAYILSRYKAHGISTFGFFILGLEGETEQTIDETIRFACELPLDHANVSIYTPYPGSPLFDKLLAEGRDITDWNQYFHYHGQDEFSICGLSNEQLRKAMHRFYARFYGNPRRAVGLAQDVRRSGVRQFARIARTVFA